MYLPNEWNHYREVEERKYPFENIVINIDDIEIVERIGSDSANGRVYRIRFKEKEYAMKIMPRRDDNSEEENRKEIETAIAASKYSEYFPIVFSYGFLPVVYNYPDKQAIFYNNICRMKRQIDKRLIDSLQKQGIVDFQPQLKILIKRFDNDVRNGLDIEELKEKYNLNEKEFNLEQEVKCCIQILQSKNQDISPLVKYCIQANIQADYLISEIANEDLGNWMKTERSILRSIDEWILLLSDIIKGINCLTENLKKIHPDLHPGNILVIKENGRFKALIHDFGRCFDIPNKEVINSSLLSFCKEFLSCSRRKI